MPWIYAIVGLLIGALIGYFVARFTAPDAKKQKHLQKDLESAQFTLEQQRQELSDHFAQTATLLDTIGKDYTKLYQHMAETSRELLPHQPEQDNPFTKLVAQPETQPQETETQESVEESKVTDIDQAPRDYANGATGLLKEEEKEILHTPEVATAKAS
ncbi:Z-ring associated protein ZapG [Vibrio agarivorans]|uniref:Z-ring associated protein ZapG n=1 Tax=Vibrio agarivorans TaxID=153622 RepID=UPI00222FC37D|nr:Z-ring associated protein ZapG [Vibrio agarivorans]MDN3661561.1 Z-ring associated protein ZapG [Vibrio agarivorans]